MKHSLPKYVVLTSFSAFALLPTADANGASCPGANQNPATIGTAASEQAVICLVNAERSARGLAQFAANGQLTTAAQRHSYDMVSRNYFDHVAPAPAPYGSSYVQRFAAAGYTNVDAWGENIADGYTSARAVMSAWLASAGHCSQILDSAKFSEIGVGAYLKANPATMGAVWTQTFGSKFSARASGGSSASCPSQLRISVAETPDLIPGQPVPPQPAGPRAEIRVKSVKLGKSLTIHTSETAAISTSWKATAPSNKKAKRAASVAAATATPTNSKVTVPAPKRKGKFTVRIKSSGGELLLIQSLRVR